MVPAHELPVEAWKQEMLPHQAPRRLALYRLDDGRSALVHSSYLREDTRGRPRSYFTHVLLYGKLDLLDAARAWGSPDWQTSYPPGETKSLKYSIAVLNISASHTMAMARITMLHSAQLSL